MGIFPSKNPKIKDALVLTDTTYFDKKGRTLKRIHHSSSFKNPWIEIYKYSENGYTKQTIGTERDTIMKYKITDLQKMAKKKRLDYKFYSLENHKYEIKNY